MAHKLVGETVNRDEPPKLNNNKMTINQNHSVVWLPVAMLISSGKDTTEFWRWTHNDVMISKFIEYIEMIENIYVVHLHPSINKYCSTSCRMEMKICVMYFHFMNVNLWKGRCHVTAPFGRRNRITVDCLAKRGHARQRRIWNQMPLTMLWNGKDKSRWPRHIIHTIWWRRRKTHRNHLLSC